MLDVDFVFFDLDDTLLDHRGAERAALVELQREIEALQSVAPALLLATYDTVNREVWRAYGAGSLDKASAKCLRFERLFQAIDVEGPDPADTGDRYLHLYGRHWRYREGAHEAFGRIADRRPVGIITNGFVEIQRAKLRRFPELDRRSSAVVISEEIGLMKPDPRLFAWAARHVNVRPGRILYVGDSLHSDILGGLQAGWQTAWIDGRSDEAPEGVTCFDDWGRLVDLLE